jgi:hypothetical protein
MLAYAFLTITTAAKRRIATTPTTLFTLTVNEFRRLFDALPLRPVHTLADVPACHTGAENTKSEPAPATTTNNNDRHLQL